MKKAIFAAVLIVVAVLSLVAGIFLGGNAKESNSTVTAGDVSASTTDSQKKPLNLITPSEAKEIALNLAGFTEADVWDKDIEPDFENGKLVYEVSFEKNGTDYEYVINALNGDVLYSEVDKY